MDTILARKPRPTAVFCFNDAVAVGAIAFAQSHGFQIPGDISVVGCGDDQCATSVFPGLTTIHLPAEEIGTQAVREVEEYIKLAQSGTPEHKKQVMPVRLVERESVAALGSDRSSKAKAAGKIAERD